ncbi:MAG: hypothetical protein JKY33_01980 [Bacteroidia bacterium]|nr:hypothetical protein [Bacteroidia bacterium]
MINNLFMICYMAIDFIPETNLDKKVAKAGLFTSIFVLGISNMSYALYCLILNAAYNKTIIITLMILSIFGTYFYYVFNERGKNIVAKSKKDENKNKRIWTLILISLAAFGLFIINILLIEKLSY